MIRSLEQKGVVIPDPARVYLSPEVRPERIAKGAVLNPGCRLSGEKTLVMAGAEIGGEGPVTLENAYVGPDVRLKGGFFSSAVFLKGASMGSGAHVRAGTILEEQASGAHTVGLKQTILFPFVTLGSLINFCDCLMAGGTSRKNHSEVGSSYIHFNYTPQQDKATPSLMGNVPEGVMLASPPVFLGGQGGLVGPCRIAFGTVIAAGSVWRKDQEKPDRMVWAGLPKASGSVPHVPGLYKNIKRIVRNNLHYIASLMALEQWYVHARGLFVSGDMETALHQGLVQTLALAVDERIRRFSSFAEKMPESARILKSQEKAGAGAEKLLDQKKQLFERLKDVEGVFQTSRGRDGLTPQAENFLKYLSAAARENKDYLTAIQALSPERALAGTQWLRELINEVEKAAFEVLPTLA